LASAKADLVEDVRLPDYDQEDVVTVDVITLDSASCAPCQYMVGAVLKARQQVDVPVKVREHKVTTREGVAHMVKLGVEKVPTICIDGQVQFASIIPDMRTLTAAIVERARAKAEAKAKATT
jgi:uroporphyrinogen decarboxylase